MKPIKKKSAIALIVLIALAIVAGTIFSFVPMTFGQSQYKSFAGAIRVGNDFSAGMYAEYDISPEGETGVGDINKSISDIKEILSEKGYPSTNVYSVNNEKIRVEVSYESGGSNFKNAYNLLKAVGVGAFELRSSSNESDTYIIGSKHIKGVTISSYTSYTYVTLEFNSAGEEAYQQLLNASDTIYVVMGGNTQTSFSSKDIASASSTLPLTFNNYNSAVDFAMRVRFGSIPVTLNSDTVVINTIGVRSSILACIIGLAVVVVAALAVLSVRYGVIGLLNIASTALAVIASTILMFAIPLVEINASTLLAIIAGFLVATAMKTLYAERILSEYKSGKTIEASLDAGRKKSLPQVVAFASAMLIASVMLAMLSNGLIQSCSIIMIIFSVIGLIESLVVLPGLVNIFETFNKGQDKPYHIKREEV